jgi:hypothetical protein
VVENASTPAYFLRLTLFYFSLNHADASNVDRCHPTILRNSLQVRRSIPTWMAHIGAPWESYGL